MPRFIVLGHGGTATPKGQKEQEAAMGRWMSWFGSVGKAVVDPGAPFMGRKTLGNVANATAANGYMIVEASDLASASKLAASSPAAAEGQGLEIIELRDMRPPDL